MTAESQRPEAWTKLKSGEDTDSELQGDQKKYQVWRGLLVRGCGAGCRAESRESSKDGTRVRGVGANRITGTAWATFMG